MWSGFVIATAAKPSFRAAQTTPVRLGQRNLASVRNVCSNVRALAFAWDELVRLLPRSHNIVIACSYAPSNRVRKCSQVKFSTTRLRAATAISATISGCR